MVPEAQRRRVLVFSAIAVAIAIGMAAAVLAVVPRSVSGVANPNSSGIDCMPSGSGTLYMGANVTLAGNDATTVNGTTYWYASFIPGHYELDNSTPGYLNAYDPSSVAFHGVTFVFSPEVDSLLHYGPGAVWNFTNLVFLHAGTACTFTLPVIHVYFTDGSMDGENQVGVYILASGGRVTSGSVEFHDTTNPWFTAHASPRAGISYDAGTGEITLYVSTS